MLKQQNILNKIIIVLTLVLTINFVTPNYSQASVKSALADGVQTLVCFFADGIINIEQKLFKGDSAIVDIRATERCSIKYGVATIVSGTLDFFNINFFTDSEPSYVVEEEYESTFLRNIYPSVRDELDELIDKFNAGELADYSNYTFTSEMETILTASRYKDTGNSGADANGYTRSFSSLMGNDWNELDISEAWNQVYPNDSYYESDFYKVFCNGGQDSYTYGDPNKGETINSYYTLISKYFDEEGKVKKEEFMTLFKKIDPVIEKVYEANLTKTEIATTASALAPTVRKWYVALRNFALVLLLSILVYMGIKIVISSTANDKAAYKQKIVNVLVAICLLFIMQYIMSITMYLVDVINESIGVNIISDTGEDVLMSEVRTKAEISKTGDKILVYTIIYAVLVWYTVIFTVMYIKRILTIVILTIFAPLVTITYPLDKEKDGKSQAFNFWFKEYIFNLLIQPIHLLLYYIFVSMAMELIKSGNFVWAIIALWFMRRAEKIMRKMFKLDDSDTLSEIGAFASGAALTGALRKLAHKATPKGKKGSKDDSGKSNKDNKIRTKDIEETFKDDDNSSDIIKQKDNKEENNEDSSKQKDNKTEEKNKAQQKMEKNKKTDKQMKQQEKSNKRLNKDLSGRDKKSVLRGVKRIGRKTFTGRNIAKLARGVGKVGLGAAGLTMGVGAGIATGDLSNVFKYGTTGLIAGTGTVDAIAGGIGTIGNAGKAIKEGAIAGVDEFKIGYNNYTQKEYEEKVLIPRIKKQNAKDKEIQDKYIRELGSKEFLNSSARDELYNAGITDEDKIIKALKIQQEQGISNDQLVQNAVIASKINEYKDLELREKQLRNILEQSGANNEKIEEEIKNRMKAIKKLSGMN